jgi:hypothetical protein
VSDRHILLLFNLTANGVLVGGSGTSIKQNTQYASHKITYHAQTKHSTQTIKDSLHTMNKTPKSKAIPVTSRGGL